MVSIIILNYNGEKLLQNCLDSVFQSDYPNFEVIVIDNASKDQSVKIIEKTFPTIVIKRLEKNHGFAYPNNLAAKISHGDFLFFLNNDTRLQVNSISELVEKMIENKKIAVGQSLLLHEDGSVDSSGDFVTKHGITFSSKRKDVDSPTRILSAKGAAMMVRKSIFEELHGFDEDYFISFEDVEFGWRAAILEYESYLIPSSVVYHLGGQTLGQISSLVTFHGVKNALTLVTTHFEKKHVVKNVIKLYFHFFCRFLGLEKSNANTKFTINKKNAIKAGIWYLGNLNKIWKKHKILNSQRKVSTKKLEELGLIL